MQRGYIREEKKVGKLIATVFLTMLLLSGVIGYDFSRSHTAVLRDNPWANSYLKAEEIQPVFGTITISGTQDTEVWITEAEGSGRRFKIGYITPGMTEKITLDKGK